MKISDLSDELDIVMFWGLTLEGAQKRYTQTAEEALHLSMAALEPNTGNGWVSLMFQQHDGKQYMLCSLDKDKCIQQPLDLNFAKGEKITFYLTGKGKVHLTGFLSPNDYLMDGSDVHSESEEEESMTSPLEALAKKRKQPQMVSSAKRARMLMDEEAEEVSDSDVTPDEDGEEDDGDESDDEGGDSDIDRFLADTTADITVDGDDEDEDDSDSDEEMTSPPQKQQQKKPQQQQQKQKQKQSPSKQSPSKQNQNQQKKQNNANATPKGNNKKGNAQSTPKQQSPALNSSAASTPGQSGKRKKRNKKNRSKKNKQQN